MRDQCPRIAHTDAVLEHQTAEDNLAFVTAMREHTDGTGAVDAGGDELTDFDVIPLRRRHAFPACGGDSGVKRRTAIIRQPIARRDHAAQHGRRDLALTCSIPKCLSEKILNLVNWL